MIPTNDDALLVRKDAAAAWDAAWAAAYQRMADRLVRLIGEAR